MSYWNKNKRGGGGGRKKKWILYIFTNPAGMFFLPPFSNSVITARGESKQNLKSINKPIIIVVLNGRGNTEKSKKATSGGGIRTRFYSFLLRRRVAATSIRIMSVIFSIIFLLYTRGFVRRTHSRRWQVINAETRAISSGLRARRDDDGARRETIRSTAAG